MTVNMDDDVAPKHIAHHFHQGLIHEQCIGSQVNGGWSVTKTASVTGQMRHNAAQCLFERRGRAVPVEVVAKALVHILQYMFPKTAGVAGWLTGLPHARWRRCT